MVAEYYSEDAVTEIAVVYSAFIFFAFFGFADEARDHKHARSHPFFIRSTFHLLFSFQRPEVRLENRTFGVHCAILFI
jgi:hypothetical protein